MKYILLPWLHVQLWWTGWDIWFVKRRLKTMQEDLEVLRQQESNLQDLILEQRTAE